jgi:hypothetical protein
LLPYRDNKLTHENGEEQQSSGQHRVFTHATPTITKQRQTS